MRYIEHLNSKFHIFLHQIYRLTTKQLGLSATIESLCHYMKQIAKEMHPDCAVFFYTHGGKLARPITQSRMTPENITNQLIFGKKWLKKLDEQNLYDTFLDEK